MKLINLLEYNVSPQTYFAWCKQNNIPVMRFGLAKFRIRDEDYVIFKLKFSKDEDYRAPNKDYF